MQSSYLFCTKQKIGVIKGKMPDYFSLFFFRLKKGGKKSRFLGVFGHFFAAVVVILKAGKHPENAGFHSQLVSDSIRMQKKS